MVERPKFEAVSCLPTLLELVQLTGLTSDMWLEYECDPQPAKRDILQKKWEDGEKLEADNTLGNIWVHRLTVFDSASTLDVRNIDVKANDLLKKHRKAVKLLPAYRILMRSALFKNAVKTFEGISQKKIRHPFTFFRFICVTSFSLAWLLIQRDPRLRFVPKDPRKIRRALLAVETLRKLAPDLRFSPADGEYLLRLRLLLATFKADHGDRRARRNHRIDATFPQREFLRIAVRRLWNVFGDSLPSSSISSLVRTLCEMIDYAPDNFPAQASRASRKRLGR